MIIYFAHPISMYGSKKEKIIMKELEKIGKVINPGLYPGKFENKEYLKMVEKSDILVFSSKNGIIGKGTYEEIKHAKNLGKDVFYFDGKLYYKKYYLENIDESNWREYCQVKVYKKDGRYITVIPRYYRGKTTFREINVSRNYLFSVYYSILSIMVNFYNFFSHI